MAHSIGQIGRTGKAGPQAALVALLARTDTFSALPSEVLHQIVQSCPTEEVAAGALLFRQGDPGRVAYLVVRGAFDVIVTMHGQDMAVARVDAGGLVGEVAAFSEARRTATVRAHGPAHVMRIDQSVVQDLLARHPGVGAAVIAQLGARLQRLNGTFAALTRATQALASDAFEPGMLRALRESADRYSLFADTFEAMAAEIQAKRALSHEMRTAADIQRSFLPGRLRAGKMQDRFAIHAAMTPAAQVGGDFYDYFMVGPQTLCVVVGDVSGKGIPASIFMSVSRTVLKTVARSGGSLEEIVARANDVLAEDNREGMFVTLAVARIDLLSGECDLVSAGHEEILLLRGAGRPQRFAVTGPAAGLFEGATYTAQTLRLRPGDSLILATDGVTEAFDPEGRQFGPTATEALLQDLNGADPEVIVTALFDAVHSFAAGHPQSDDITCLALRFLGQA